MKFYWTLPLIGLLALSSCKKDEEEDAPDTAKEPTTITCSDFSGSMTLTNDPDLDVDYIIDCELAVTGAFVVEAGTHVQFNTGAGISVDGSGSITALGSAASPIIFEGSSDINGSWKGIFIRTNDVNNRLEYVTIRHGGGEAFNSNDDKGNIVLYATGRITIDHCTIANSAQYGLNGNYSDADLSVTNTSFNNNTLAPILLQSNLAHNIASNNSFTGNGDQVVRLRSEEIEQEVTWHKLTVPYLIMDDDYGITRTVNIRDNGGVTIEAGTDIKFDSNTGIYISDGYLEAIGTASEPITFKGDTEVAGSWKGLFFDGANVRNRLDYAEVAYAGSTEMGGYYATIMLWADTYLSITNSILRDPSANASCGINAPLNGVNLINTGNTFTNITTEVCN